MLDKSVGQKRVKRGEGTEEIEAHIANGIERLQNLGRSVDEETIRRDFKSRLM